MQPQWLVQQFLRFYTHRMFGGNVMLYTCFQHSNGNVEICYHLRLNEQGDTIAQHCVFNYDMVWLMFIPPHYSIVAMIIQDAVAAEMRSKWYNTL